MPQQSVARPGERRAEKEQKEIERHCAVECRGPWPGKGFGTEEMDWRAIARQGVAHGLEGFGAWQTASLNAVRSTVPWLSWLMDGGLESCGVWQTAPLTALKSRVPWLDWLVDIAKRRGAGLGEF